MKDAANEGITLVFALPSEGAFGGQVRVGFKPQFFVPWAYRPLVWLPRRRRLDGLTLSGVNTFDARFDVFFKRGRDRELSVRRNADYLQWRYYAHPTKTYETITCERDGQICSHCVLEMGAAAKLSLGRLVALQGLPESGSAARFLAHRALRRLHSLGARVAVLWERPTGPEQEALRSFGFSSRYASIRRPLTRPPYVGQFIVFEGKDAMRAELQPGRSVADSPRRVSRARGCRLHLGRWRLQPIPVIS